MPRLPPLERAEGVHWCNRKRAAHRADQEALAMNPLRRYGRWIKRAVIILTIYLLVAFLLIGISPGQALAHPGANLASFRAFVVQAIVLMSFIILQFVALFWFLARGNNYVIYPNEYDVSFDDVRGQPAAVNSTKEVLRLFQGFKDF